MPSLDQFRTDFPELQKLNDMQAIDYISKKTGVKADDLMADFGVQAPTLGKEVGKGISRGIDQLQGTGYAGIGWLGSATGIDAVRDYGLRGFKRNQQEAAENAAAVDSYQDVHGVGDAAMYVAGGVGEALPQLIPGLGSAGLGARVAMKAATSAAVKKGLEKELVKKAAEEAVGRGAMLGGATYGIGSETANIYGDIHEKTGEDAPWTALAHGVPAGLVEGLAERTVLKDFMAGRPKGMSRKRYIAQTAGKDYLTEGVLEELPQTIIEQAAVKAVDPNQEWDTKDMIDSTLKGGIGGGIMGASSAALTREQNELGRKKTLREAVTDGINDAGEYGGRKLAEFTEGRKDKEMERSGAAAFEALHRDINAGRSMMADLDERERKLPDADLVSLMKGRADTDAQYMMDSGEFSDEEKALAIQYQTGKLTPGQFKLQREALQAKKGKADGLAGWMDGLAKSTFGGKQSLQRTERGDEAYELAKLWENEHGHKYDAELFDGSQQGGDAAAMLMEWVRSGYGAEHNNGKAQVPSALIERLGDKAHDAVASAVEMLDRQGLMSESAAKRTPAMLKRVRAEAQSRANDYGIVNKLLKPLAAKNWSKDKSAVVVNALRESKGAVSQEVKAELGKHFNDVDALVKHFVPKETKVKYAKGWKDNPATPLEADEEGNVVLSDEVQDKEIETHGSGYSVSAAEDRAKLYGPTNKGVTRPYNLADEREAENHKRVVERHTGDGASSVNALGIWSHARRNVQGEELRQAENDIIGIYGPKLLDSTDAANPIANDINPDDLNEGDRRQLLHRINKQFKFVEVETADSGDSPGKLSKDKVQKLRSEYVRNERRDESKETPENGYLYLERLHQGKPTAFPVHTMGLLKHRWSAEKREDNTDTSEGLLRNRNQVLEAINDLITSDESFTGKLMVRGADGELSEVKSLPASLKIGRGDLAKANEQADEARRKEDVSDNPKVVRYAETYGEKLRELQRLVGAKHPDARNIVAAISTRAPAKINAKYTELRNQWKGKAEGFGEAERNAFNDNQLVDHSTDKDIVPSEAPDTLQTGIRREDPQGDKPIQRGPDGAAVGIGADAAFAGYGGNSRGGEGAHTEPKRKAKRALGDQLDARDWVADLLLKGLPSFKAAQAKYAADNEVMKRVSAGIAALKSMSEVGLVNQGFSTEDAKTILSRLKSVQGDENVGSVVSSGEAGVRGQVDAVGGRGTEEVRAAGDQQGGSSETDVGADLARHYSILEKTKAVDPSTLPPNTPVWSVYKADDADTSGAPVAVFKDMGIAMHVAERDGLNLVNELAKDVGKSSEVSTLGTKATPEQVQAALDHVLKTVGDKVKVEVKKLGGISGSWSRKNDQTVIRLAINGDVLSTAYHESMHEFFSILKRNGDEAVQALLQRVATNPIMKRKLERLLAEQPAAQAQLNDPEEAAAYMYQFWRNGDLKLGPETKTFFEKIKALLNKALGLISSSVRQQNIEAKRAENDLLTAQATVEAFTEGMFADESQHAANVKAMSAEIEKVNKVNEQLGKALTEAMSKYGKLVFSAEAMMDLTDNPHFIAISRAFNQKAGDAMRHFKNGAVGSFFDATRAETDKRMNQLRTLLSHHEAEDLELARAFMSKRDVKGYKGPIWPTDRVTREIVEKIDSFFEGMAKYISDSDVKRLEMRDGKPNWVSIQMRKNYWPRVFDYDVLREQGAEFQADLLKHHGDKIEEMVKEANDPEVTAESIAEAIWMRSMNNGTIDLDETTSNLGITPAASAVNRRQLDFLDMSVFDKYMSKDLPNVLTTYTRSIVKRAEYQKRFGNGGEKIQEASDKGFLHEMGGEDLVKRTVEALAKAHEAWVKAGGKKSGEPYPTLRSVGFGLHRDEVGQQAHNEAVIAASTKLEQALKAVQAMEGTLGNNISPELRQANSWIVTYQNFRLLSTMIFTSFNDVNGVVINGGTMKDAWDTFVGGLKGVKDSYTNGDSDAQMRDAEMWGTVDAGSTMDAIGQTYGSVWMSGKAKKMSDAFFKYTGAEGWNRGIRSVATAVAQRTIKRMAADPSYMTDPAKKAQFERLFGKGASPQDIKLLPNGELDPSDQRNVAAVNRWVLDAIPAPNASHRPIWGSDPHYQTFIHLKNYTYTWHRTILQSAIEQARLGNLRPAAVAALGYIPIAIAAGAIKGMLMPGDEPAWMKQGLSGWLKYGVMVGGIGGVPQMYANDLLEGDVAKLLGPMFDQLQDAATIPLGEASLINAGPVDVGWRDHKAVVETLGALPGGTMWKRWGY